MAGKINLQPHIKMLEESCSISMESLPDISAKRENREMIVNVLDLSTLQGAEIRRFFSLSQRPFLGDVPC